MTDYEMTHQECRDAAVEEMEDIRLTVIDGNPYDASESAGNRPGSRSARKTEGLPPKGKTRASASLKLEKEYQQDVTDYAERQGWQWYHPYDSTRSRPGWPDLVLWHPRHGVIFRELKRDGEYPTADQVDTIRSLQAAGADAKVWWLPSQWEIVERELNP